jgi:arsenate reductase (glutaredoxin)
LRFFSERRLPVAFVDLARKAMAVGELRRFAQQFGAKALLDTESARYRELGLAYLSMDDDGAFERLIADQRLLRLPLVRAGDKLSVGVDEAAWRGWLAAEREGS